MMAALVLNVLQGQQTPPPTLLTAHAGPAHAGPAREPLCEHSAGATSGHQDGLRGKSGQSQGRRTQSVKH